VLLVFAATVTVRQLTRHVDPTLLPIVALLTGLGLVMIHRLDLVDATRATQTGAPVPVAAAPALPPNDH